MPVDMNGKWVGKIKGIFSPKKTISSGEKIREKLNKNESIILTKEEYEQFKKIKAEMDAAIVKIKSIEEWASKYKILTEETNQEFLNKLSTILGV